MVEPQNTELSCQSNQKLTFFSSLLEADPTDWDAGAEWNLHPADNRQIYAFTVWPHKGVYFGFARVYESPIALPATPCDSVAVPCNCVNDTCKSLPAEPGARHEEDVLTAYLLTSRDGEHWDSFFAETRQELIPRGGAGEFDDDMISVFASPLPTGDGHWLYYGGADERHGTPYPYRSMKIGAAKVDWDRWGGRENGVVLTKPFVLAGAALEVNAEAIDLVVEVLDGSSERVLAVSTAATIDESRFRPTWDNVAGLAPYVGALVRLRFTIPSGIVYGFQLLPATVVNRPGGGALEGEDLIVARPSLFSETTTIHYALPRTTKMRLRVVDVTGRLILTLRDGLQGPGSHSIQWDGRDQVGRRVGPGNYFVQLSSGTGLEATERVTLIR